MKRKLHKIKQLSLALLVTGSTSAATITWDPVVANTTAADILTGGSLHESSNSAGTTDETINGVLFTSQSAGPLASNANGTFFTAGTGVNTTGDIGLDALLDSHSYSVGGPSSATFDITGLTPGDTYQIQIIAVGDTRGCCATRSQSFGGDGSFSADLSRADPSSVVGTFVADVGGSQTITANGSQDGGLSGFQVRNVSVPEPGSALLSLVGLIGLAARRRRS